MQQIGRYQVTGELGRGAMGVVYEAIDPLIGRTIAVKTLHIQATQNPEEGKMLRERLFREARSAGMLFHPGIVVVFDVGEDGDTAFIAMERVEGETLQQYLTRHPKIDSSALIDILRQTADALDFAHASGVIHRDIKPANIMLHKNKSVKVADFGIAKIAESYQNTQTGVVLGTPYYMAPEQIKNTELSGRSDQFSLAVVAFEMLTGAKPFKAESIIALAHEIAFGPRPWAQGLDPNVPPSVDAVLHRAMAIEPSQRYATCSEFVQDLADALLTVTQTIWPEQYRTDTFAAGAPTQQQPFSQSRHDPQQTPLPPPPAAYAPPPPGAYAAPAPAYYPPPPAATPQVKRSSSGWKWVAAFGVLIAAAAAGIFVYKDAIFGDRISGGDTPVDAQFTADPPVIERGGVVTLSWSVPGGKVSIVPDVGNVPETGSVKVRPLKPTTYTLVAQGLKQPLTAALTVNVTPKQTSSSDTPPGGKDPDPKAGNDPKTGTDPKAGNDPKVITPPALPPKILDFRAEPGSVTRGESFRLSWRVEGATSVSIDHEVGDVSNETSRSVVARETGIYKLTATSAGGSVEASAHITVVEPAPRITQFKPFPETIEKGGVATLRWTVENATAVTLNGTAVPPNGTRQVSPSITTTYTLRVNVNGREIFENATVFVSKAGSKTGGPGDGGVRGSGPVPRVQVNAEVMEQTLISKSIPFYPPEAQSKGIQGTVRFNAVIGVDGKIVNLQYLSGPQELVAAATDSAKRRLYQKPLQNGKPVEVSTQIEIRFVSRRTP